MILAAVPLASFLSFSVQPLVGKYLVPWHGGSASTWIATMLFFQTALVLGYLWAFWLGGKPPALQSRVTIALAAVAAVATLLPPPRLLTGAGSIDVLLSLAVALLPALVLLFSTGLLLQRWLQRAHGEVPYYLYAVSNLGSLGALAAYPFWIEPLVGLGVQTLVWRGGLVALVVLLIVIAWRVRGAAASDESAPAEAEQIPTARKLSWLWLSALTCTCMLGATQHLSAEIGSNPMSWIIPLGIYLASFSVTFTGWWREGATSVCLAVLAVSLTGFMLLKGVAPEPIMGWPALWLILVVAAASCVGTGSLYALRPRREFLQFYVVLGVGGVVGGLFSSLSAPNLLPRNYEFIGAAALLLATGLVRLVQPAGRLRAAVAAVIVLAPVVGVVWTQESAEADTDQTVYHWRNTYGHVHLIQRPALVTLRSETTLHGAQVISTEAARRRPTAYYIESSGAGVVLERLQSARAALRVGVVGLGAGTLAAYSRTGDTFTFWDIDPKVFRLASVGFTYLQEARGTIELQRLDGRKGLEAPGAPYDLLVIDAFSGDAIPTHLLTLEAMRTYLDRLAVPGGLLLIHASNRYVDLLPVITRNARALGWEAFRVNTAVKHATAERDYYPARSAYVLVHPPARTAELEAWFPLSEDAGRVTRTLKRLAPDAPRLVLWTDDRHSIRDVLMDGWLWPAP